MENDLIKLLRVSATGVKTFVALQAISLREQQSMVVVNQNHLHEMTGLSMPTIVNSLRELEEKGCIAKQRVGNGGRNKATRYEMLLATPV